MAPLTPLFNMFGQSPIRPLQTHMEKASSCAQTLLPFFTEVLAGNWEKAEQHQKTINSLEKDADKLKKDIRLHLPKSLFLPVPRSDLLEMLTMQDKLANRAQDIAGVVLGRQMHFPEVIATPFIEFLKRCLNATSQAQKAIDELDELLETGFRGAEAQLVEEMIIELDKIEQDTDELQVSIRHQLFSLESQLPPIDVMFLYKIIEWTGDLADRAHKIGAQLELLLAQ